MATTTDSAGRRQVTFPLTSAAFKDGGEIPAQFTCDGANHSPPLSWSGAPAQTAAFALIVEDPDAPAGTFIHWVLYDLSGATNALPEGIPKGGSLPQLGGARQGRTSAGDVGYGGPCPPPGAPHHYHFRLFALDAKLGLEAGATRDQVMSAMRGHELGSAEIVGLCKHRR
jgi:Raf kinase inhibitor-like YbhB/YbcL family protein